MSGGWAGARQPEARSRRQKAKRCGNSVYEFSRVRFSGAGETSAGEAVPFQPAGAIFEISHWLEFGIDLELLVAHRAGAGMVRE